MTIVEWLECMGVASGCGEQVMGVASGSGWNLWVWLLGVVVKRYIDFLILLIPTRLVFVLFYKSFFFLNHRQQQTERKQKHHGALPTMT